MSSFSDQHEITAILQINDSIELDYDQGEINNTCIIVAFDRGTPSLSANATLIIELIDENDNTPVVHGTPINGNVSRFAEPGEIVIYKINTTDADSGLNGEIQFKLSKVINGYSWCFS